MTKLSLTCGLVLTLAACASDPTTSAPAAAAVSAPAAPAATTTPAAGTASTPQATASTKPKLVCDDTNQMGSHMMTRICLTPEQVEARRKAAQQAAFEAQNKAKPVNSSGTPP